jgi:hypothetical protein
LTDEGRLAAALAAIDAANADDPVTITVRGAVRPKELAHSELTVEWVQALRPDAGEALLLAARAAHVRRWELPRSAEPEGKAGYLRWKRRLQAHHASVAGALLTSVGYEPAVVERVQSIVRKEALRTDPEVITLEDALALVFVETQFVELADRLDEDHMVDVVAKTLRKMSPEGRSAALGIPLPSQREAGIVARAVESLPE